MGDLHLSSGLSASMKRDIILAHLFVQHGATMDDLPDPDALDHEVLIHIHETWDIADDDESDFDVSYDGECVVLVATTGEVEDSYELPPDLAFSLGVELLANAAIAATVDRALSGR